MRSIVFNQPLGIVMSYAPVKREWIAAAIGAVGGIASSLIGGAQAAKAVRAAESRQRSQEAREAAWYNRRFYEDYLDTSAGQNLVRRAKEWAREQNRRAAGTQAVTGGTEASVAAAKEAGNKMVGDTIASIAATDQSRKAQVDNMHRQAESQFAQMDMNRELQRAQNISNASQNMSNAMMSAGSALEQTSATQSLTPPNLVGGSNNSIPYTRVGSTGKVYSNGKNTIDLTATDASIRSDIAKTFGR